MELLNEYDQILRIKSKFELLMELELKIINNVLFVKKFDITDCIGMERVTEPSGIKSLLQTSKTELYNSEIFRWLACSMKKSFVLGYDEYNIKHIRDVIQTMERFFGEKAGEKEGNYGEIWKANIKGVSDLVLVKVYKNTIYTRGPFHGYKADTNIHEFFIGYFLNQLRSTIPNFMYIYALFTCKGPDKGEVCPAEGTNKDYMVMEYISGVSFKEFIQIRSDVEIFAVYLQIILAVGLAYEKYDYTHYDLHTGNVLVQELSEDVVIKYQLRNANGNNVIFYIKTRYLAKIIDYGTSYINVHFGNEERRSFGNFYLTHGNVEATKSNPYHDLFKITGFMLSEILSKNEQQFLYYYNLLLFFSGFGFSREPPNTRARHFHTLGTTINYNYGSSYDIPNNSDFVFLDFISHILKYYRKFLLNNILFNDQPPNIKLFDCSDNKCSSVDEINQKANDMYLNESIGERKRRIE